MRVTSCKQTNSKVVWILITNGVEDPCQVLFYLTHTLLRSGVSHNLKESNPALSAGCRGPLDAVELAWLCWTGEKWLLDTREGSVAGDKLVANQ